MNDSTKKSGKTGLKMPEMRVSQKVYIQVMHAVIEEATHYAPDRALWLIFSVREYLSKGPKFKVEPEIETYFLKFKKIIDLAMERSAKAREAARLRRERREAAAKELNEMLGEGSDNAQDPITKENSEIERQSDSHKPTVQMKC